MNDIGNEVVNNVRQFNEAFQSVTARREIRKKHQIKDNDVILGDHEVRAIWDEEKSEWWFSIVDIVGAITDSPSPRKYWSVLKTRLKQEGNETATNCSQLKLQAEDGKMRLTDVADQEQMFRVIQSIPSPKAEPFKMWMARIASERIDQMQDPELSIKQALDTDITGALPPQPEQD